MPKWGALRMLHRLHLQALPGLQETKVKGKMQVNGKQYVLRKKPPGQVLASAHAVEREFQVLAALKDTPVPVPQALCLCQDTSVIGTPFYVMAHVEASLLAHLQSTHNQVCRSRRQCRLKLKPVLHSLPIAKPSIDALLTLQ